MQPNSVFSIAPLSESPTLGFIQRVRQLFAFSDISQLRKTLLIRFGLAAVLLSLSLGGAAFFYQLEQMDELLVGAARHESVLIAALVSGALSKPQPDKQLIESQLRTFIDSRRAFVGGHFILSEIYSPYRKKVAELSHSGLTAIGAIFDKYRHAFPDDKSFVYKKLLIYGQVYMRVLLPMSAPDGRLIGYFEGIYRADPNMVSEIKKSVFAIVAFVIISVLVTTFFLFPLILRMHRRILRASHELLTANLHSLEVLGSSIAKRDSDTHQHNYRVVLYSVKLAELVGLDTPAIRSLIKGAFLHDVGKIGISDLILLKPGKLDAEEFEIMKTHVQHGVDIVANSPWLQDAVAVVHGHHEKFDGSGYPQGLSGDAIPLSARIFAIVDVFDALTSQRPYKEAFSLEKTMAILEESRGNHFDSALLDTFQKVAAGLYEKYAGRDDEGVEKDMNEVVLRHFIL